ncbi:efflux RND transporter periplasmic adaptor subunit [Paenibacillus sp. GCM10023248]|uniref:HlyD family efflux transporter periplasmic adaptor subunit n=1 Tax=Bacillales TaxID=1385 RepID=UPI0023794A2A|nr:MULTISPECIES: HlyD family efflux transporter periplasmic adaptor subunit [Bacillales]MDD9268060.1 HlyD family efflux transporter periplasmic adaptor subunit [Paenibacillus sp. MAHUQ-63]MDR6879734.1 HlyD family secretion protein [Bacillus sp. 3255]
MSVSRKKKWIIIVLAAMLCGAGTYYYIQNKAQPATAATQQQTAMKVSKGAISSSISGTSQLDAKDKQNIVIPVDGIIKTMNLTQNQPVKKGDVLLELSVPSTETNLKEAQVTLQQLEKELAELQSEQNHMSVSATMSGKLTLTANLDAGSQVSKTTKIGTISDTSQFKVKLPFPLQDAVQLQKGGNVELSVDGYLLTKVGTVSSVSREIKADANGNKIVDVEVLVTNDGTLSAGLKMKGSVGSGDSLIESTEQAALEYVRTTPVFAEAGGTIKTMKFKDGETVKQGDLIASLFNDDLQQNIVSKQAAIESQQIKVDDAQQKVNQLTITAPFDGVFSADFANSKSNVLRNYPVGAQITANTTLGAVASLSTMQLAIAVDELDLTSVKVGQKAVVKVDAISGKSFEGEVTSVSNVGTTTNGVTTYDAVVSIPNSASNELKYAMTATAEIYIQDKKDILVLPIQVVTTTRGKSTVTLKKADGTVEEQHEIKTGIRSKTQVEIVSGLAEGDEVVMPTRKATTTTGQQQTGGFPGGEGGPPAGFQGGGGNGGFQGQGGGGTRQ